MNARSSRALFVAAYVAYVSVVSLVVARVSHEESVFELGFGFGPAIERVASGHGLADGSRLPFVPYFLAGIARVSDSVLFATWIKNLVIQAPVGWMVWRLLAGDAPRALKMGAIVYLLTFPQLVRHAFGLVPEEGYLVAFLGLAFAWALRARASSSVRALVPCAIALVLAELTKSSMILVVPCLAALVAWRSRSFRVVALFGGAVLSGAIAWGAMNARTTGHFAITSSNDGYNFWKGNNERTLDYFPWRNLDAISEAAPEQRPGEDEWAWDRRCFEEGLRFDRAHPLDATKIFGWRVHQVFLSIRAEEPVAPSERRDWLRVAGLFHMLLFRIVFLGCLASAARTVFSKARAQGSVEDRKDARAAAIAYLAFVFAFAAPYLLAWGVERRLMPLVIPTVLYALHGREVSRKERPRAGNPVTDDPS